MFEAIEEHAGCYEIVAILTDDGFGVALFVPKQPGVDSNCSRCARATPSRRNADVLSSICGPRLKRL